MKRAVKFAGMSPCHKSRTRLSAPVPGVFPFPPSSTTSPHYRVIFLLQVQMRAKDMIPVCPTHRKIRAANINGALCLTLFWTSAWVHSLMPHSDPVRWHHHHVILKVRKLRLRKDKSPCLESAHIGWHVQTDSPCPSSCSLKSCPGSAELASNLALPVTAVIVHRLVQNSPLRVLTRLPQLSCPRLLIPPGSRPSFE